MNDALRWGGPHRIPLVAQLASEIIEEVFNDQREGFLRLPAIPVRATSANEVMTHWRPTSEILAGSDYILGFSQTFERVGTVTVPLPGADASGGLGMSTAHEIYKIRVSIYTKNKVKLLEREKAFDAFVLAFKKHILDMLPKIARSNQLGLSWVLLLAPSGEFDLSQIDDWFEFEGAPAPKLLTRDAKAFRSEDIKIGDTIFHGDGGGGHSGAVGLIVTRSGKRYALSAAHVVSLHGRAAMNTDVFAAAKVSTGRPRRRVGRFAGPASLSGTFAPKSTVTCDAGLVELAIRSRPNEIVLDKRARKIEGFKEIELSEREDRPAVLIVRPDQVLQLAEVGSIYASTVMLGEHDAILFYEQLIELRAARKNLNIVPARYAHDVSRNDRISKGGDSGSVVLAAGREVWTDDAPFTAVGLLLGGNEVPGIQGVAYAVPITRVKKELDFELKLN